MLNRLNPRLNHEEIYDGILIRGITVWDEAIVNFIQHEDNFMIKGSKVSSQTKSIAFVASPHNPIIAKPIVKERTIEEMSLLDFFEDKKYVLKSNKNPQNVQMYV